MFFKFVLVNIGANCFVVDFIERATLLLIQFCRQFVHGEPEPQDDDQYKDPFVTPPEHNELLVPSIEFDNLPCPGNGLGITYPLYRELVYKCRDEQQSNCHGNHQIHNDYGSKLHQHVLLLVRKQENNRQCPYCGQKRCQNCYEGFPVFVVSVMGYHYY